MDEYTLPPFSVMKSQKGKQLFAKADNKVPRAQGSAIDPQGGYESARKDLQGMQSGERQNKETSAEDEKQKNIQGKKKVADKAAKEGAKQREAQHKKEEKDTRASKELASKERKAEADKRDREVESKYLTDEEMGQLDSIRGHKGNRGGVEENERGLPQEENVAYENDEPVDGEGMGIGGEFAMPEEKEDNSPSFTPGEEVPDLLMDETLTPEEREALPRARASRPRARGSDAQFDSKWRLDPDQTRFPAHTYDESFIPNSPRNVGEGPVAKPTPVEEFDPAAVAGRKQARANAPQLDPEAQWAKLISANPGKKFTYTHDMPPSIEKYLREHDLLEDPIWDIANFQPDMYIQNTYADSPSATVKSASASIPPIPSFSEIRKAKQAGGIHNRKYDCL